MKMQREKALTIQSNGSYWHFEWTYFLRLQSRVIWQMKWHFCLLTMLISPSDTELLAFVSRLHQ